MTAERVDLGEGVWAEPVSYWGIKRAGLLVGHPGGPNATPGFDGACVGTVLFDLDVIRERFPDKPVWTVEQAEPLTLSPSISCSCGFHGWIRNGRWVTA